MKDSSARDGSVLTGLLRAIPSFRDLPRDAQLPPRAASSPPSCWGWGSLRPTSSPATPNPGPGLGFGGTHPLGIPGGFIPTASPGLRAGGEGVHNPACHVSSGLSVLIWRTNLTSV